MKLFLINIFLLFVIFSQTKISQIQRNVNDDSILVSMKKYLITDTSKTLEYEVRYDDFGNVIYKGYKNGSFEHFYKFDENQNLINYFETSIYRSDTIIYKYNYFNKLTYKEARYKDKIYKTDYFYLNDTILIKEIYLLNDSLYLINEFSYDDRFQKTLQEFKFYGSFRDGYSTFKYDANGRLIELFTSDYRDVGECFETFKYDKNDTLIYYSEHYPTFGNKNVITENFFDENYNLVKLIKKDTGCGGFENQTFFIYENDLLKRTETERNYSSCPPSSEYIDNTYYPNNLLKTEKFTSKSEVFESQNYTKEYLYEYEFKED